MRISLTDTHAHLDLPDFSADIEAVIKKSLDAGVNHIVCVGTGIGSSGRCIELAGLWPRCLSASAGIHPNYCCEHGSEDIDRLAELAGLPQVAAIGETGLDYYHDYSGRKQQEDFFRRHIELSLELSKPLIIHGRRSDEDILRILDSFAALPPGIRHCFDGPPHLAGEYFERGIHISFGGLITRDGYKKLKKAAAETPEEKLLLETDCPYLTPAGAAGKRNEPAFLKLVADALAELRGVDTDHIAAVTTANASGLGLTGTSGKELKGNFKTVKQGYYGKFYHAP